MPEDDPVVLLSVKLLVILQVNQFDIGQFYLSNCFGDTQTTVRCNLALQCLSLIFFLPL